MRAGTPKGLRAELNVTPLVDVVLVLLIIFMVVTPLLQKGRAVELPRARASIAEPRRGAHHVLLTLTADKRLILDRTEVAGDDLPGVVSGLVAGSPNIEVFIKADSRLTYGDVRKLMRKCHDAGAKRIALATRDFPPAE
jgi:biopolymer transport protein ExbD